MHKRYSLACRLLHPILRLTQGLLKACKLRIFRGSVLRGGWYILVAAVAVSFTESSYTESMLRGSGCVGLWPEVFTSRWGGPRNTSSAQLPCQRRAKAGGIVLPNLRPLWSIQIHEGSFWSGLEVFAAFAEAP